MLSEPILICDLSIEEVKSLKEVPLGVDMYVGHTQSVEKVVKEISNAASRVYGYERSDG